MKRFWVFFVIVIFLLIGNGCASEKKAYNEKRGLMLLENTQLGRNKEYNSKHYRRTLNKTYKKYKNNN